ncbi:MAG TPA: hypothetical protein VGR46_03105 [Candidatus Limnocylindria bacterium]|jgi:hypothetical protein|nr:hypothetical protein [Candidatus Limnocylindria bacterium]
MFGAGRTALPVRSTLLAPFLLFVASATFTLWRNTQVGVLVDIAYVLNTATRIAAGDVPYAQFPLVLAPLEFLTQALLIKAFGPHFFIQIAYATILGGLGTALAYTIARRLVDTAGTRPGALAAILSIPLVPLGIYAIYPHPFYDPDTCLATLATLAAILAARDRPTPARGLLAGALLAVPVFIKQTIGGAFLVLMVVALAADALAQPSARASFRWIMAGLVVWLGLEVAALQLVVGVDKYLIWTWNFALSGRGLALERLRAFVDPFVIWPGGVILGLAVFARFLAVPARGPIFVAGLCLPLFASAFVPALFPAVPAMFPPLLIAASVLSLIQIARAGVRFETLVPLVLAGTATGAIMSQGLYGSTYGIFPLLILALASLVRDLGRFIERPARLAAATGAVLAVIITVAGTTYTLENKRLRFIDVDAPGPITRSSFPSLAGLSARGPYIDDLDAILFWVRDNVPADDPFVFLPGEDPAFFALGRRPRLPAVYFFDVANPYTPSELARFANDVGLRWVFVKDRLQLLDEPPLEQAIVAALTERATLVAQVGPYRVFKR